MARHSVIDDAVRDVRHPEIERGIRMFPAHEPADAAACEDDMLTIEIKPPLPCGVANCNQPARRARTERDPDTQTLWRLLPLCETHLASLAAGAADTLRAHDPA